MKRLRPIFKKLKGIFLTEIPADEIKEIKYMTRVSGQLIRDGGDSKTEATFNQRSP